MQQIARLPVPYFRKIPTVLLSGIVLLAAGCHPWFKSTLPWEEKPDPDQKPIITNAAGETYYLGTPSYVPLIDDCLSAGGTRSECIAALPPEELAKLQAEEERRGALRRHQIKSRPQLNEQAGLQSFGFVELDLPVGWFYAVGDQSGSIDSAPLTIYQPSGAGRLRMQSLIAPQPMAPQALRNMTNVDVSIELPYGHWGDYAGFEYEYVETDLHYRQWWLSNKNTILFITYSSSPEQKEVDRDQISNLVQSLTAPSP